MRNAYSHPYYNRILIYIKITKIRFQIGVLYMLYTNLPYQCEIKMTENVQTCEFLETMMIGYATRSIDI